MFRYRIQFSKEIWGVPFIVGSVEVRRARSLDRALRAAQLKFARQLGLDDWRERADIAAADEQETRPAGPG